MQVNFRTKESGEGGAGVFSSEKSNFLPPPAPVQHQPRSMHLGEEV
jgi:hypothetical protein